MDFDDSKQDMLFRTRAELEGLPHPEIVDVFLEEADKKGYQPCDLNWAGTPNIYLRGKYIHGTDNWVEDLFVMFVEAKEKDSD